MNVELWSFSIAPLQLCFRGAPRPSLCLSFGDYLQPSSARYQLLFKIFCPLNEVSQPEKEEYRMTFLIYGI